MALMAVVPWSARPSRRASRSMLKKNFVWAKRGSQSAVAAKQVIGAPRLSSSHGPSTPSMPNAKAQQEGAQPGAALLTNVWLRPHGNPQPRRPDIGPHFKPHSLWPHGFRRTASSVGHTSRKDGIKAIAQPCPTVRSCGKTHSKSKNRRTVASPHNGRPYPRWSMPAPRRSLTGTPTC